MHFYSVFSNHLMKIKTECLSKVKVYDIHAYYIVLNQSLTRSVKANFCCFLMKALKLIRTSGTKLNIFSQLREVITAALKSGSCSDSKATYYVYKVQINTLNVTIVHFSV